MKIKENVTLYGCDFCKKQMQRKHSMVAHELRCSGNPINDRPCLHCHNLERKDIEIDTGRVTYHGAEPVYRKASAFYCSAKQQLLLHPKTDYLEGVQNLFWVVVDGEEVEQFPMPTKCDIYDKESKSLPWSNI